jgi:putative SOS response-associated peptidase YedK
MRDDRPFGFAGLWETWQPGEKYSAASAADDLNPQIPKSPNRSSSSPAAAAVESCTILTTEANELVRPIHDRMPVIIDAADYDHWLDPAVAGPEPLVKLLRPYPSERMVVYAVSTLVNSPANDDPRCIEPAEGAGGGPELF